MCGDGPMFVREVDRLDLHVLGVCRQLYEEANHLLWATTHHTPLRKLTYCAWSRPDRQTHKLKSCRKFSDLPMQYVVVPVKEATVRSTTYALYFGPKIMEVPISSALAVPQQEFPS